ncbi:hypothetical protein Pfo_003930 [Paulownia fortunei]|nr:hypothetical protein Pfo_003930 [Paulownia fortunei]
MSLSQVSSVFNQTEIALTLMDNGASLDCKNSQEAENERAMIVILVISRCKDVIFNKLSSDKTWPSTCCFSQSVSNRGFLVCSCR